MPLKLYLTKSQYLKYDMNLSSFYSSTLMHNSYFLIGNYYNNTFIKLNHTINKIKFSLTVVDKFCKVNYFNYFIINLIEHISVIKFYKKILNKFNFVNYCLGRWKNGLLNNFHIRLPFMHDYINLFLFKIRLPSFVFLVDYKEFKDNIDRVSPINLELFRISANSIIFSQASTDFKKTQSLLLQNVKNVKSNLFLMNFVFSILRKYLYLKKLYFYKTIFKNKSKNMHFYIKKNLFFSYIFLKFNQLNFNKKKIWKKDLTV